MKIDELVPQLRHPFSPGDPCGVVKGTKEDNQNIWFVVPPAPPLERPDGPLPMEALASAHRVLEAMSSFTSLSPRDKLILKLVLRHEAVSSSRMEGTWSTIDDVLTPEDAEKEEASETEKANHASVRGYAVALEKSFSRVLKQGYQSFDQTLIENLHRSIMGRDKNFKGEPGKFREGDRYVYIGGMGRKEHSIYNPAPPGEVLRLTTETLEWFQSEEIVEMGDAGMGLSLPMRIAIGHSHFEAVHPFPDGNGRVGRMLWPLQMIAAGKAPLYLSGFVEAYKDDYGNALQESQKRLNYGPLIEFICTAIVQSHKHFNQVQNSLNALPEQWHGRGKFRKKSAAHRSIDLLLELPILTAKVLGEKLKISPPAANNALQKMVEAGILVERTGFRRNRVFAAEEVLRLLSRSVMEEVS